MLSTRFGRANFPCSWDGRLPKADSVAMGSSNDPGGKKTRASKKPCLESEVSLASFSKSWWGMSTKRRKTPLAGFANDRHTKRLKLGPPGLVEYENDQAGAKQDQTCNGNSEKAVGSEFIPHGTPPIAWPCAKGTSVGCCAEMSRRQCDTHRMRAPKRHRG
jgi:hypothetical protein